MKCQGDENVINFTISSSTGTIFFDASHKIIFHIKIIPAEVIDPFSIKINKNSFCIHVHAREKFL